MTTDLISTRALYPLTALLSGCFLFGLSSRSGTQAPVEATDSADGYREYLAANPTAQDAAEHRQRLAELELIEARSQLRPVFDPAATFSDQVGGSATATLGQDTQMIFESEEEGWVGFQVTRIAPKLEQTVRVFAREGEPVPLDLGRDKAGRYFSVTEPLGIPLVSTSSFDARVQQLGEYGGGMRFCFFSPSPDSCEDGYEFSYDRAHFQKYQLARKSGGQSNSLCQYQMDPNNTQHSDNLTVDPNTRGLRNPAVEIHAHRGYLTVSFNGTQICQVQDSTFTEGHFVMSETPAISELVIELNAGSTPVYARADVLVDVQAGSQPLALRNGSGNEAYDAFAADYNAYLAVVAGGDLPEAFGSSYFNLFFDKTEADEAYAAIENSKNMDDYLAYLEAFPLNAHKAKIEGILHRLALKENTIEGYQKFQAQYPDSIARLQIKKQLADIEWQETVKKPTKKSLQKYLQAYPAGYYAQRATVLLEGLDYYAAHKAEVDEARKVMAQAQDLVRQSPVTTVWDVEIMDYQNGSVYFNLNNGPIVPETTRAPEAFRFVAMEQPAAYNSTCELLSVRIPSIDFCVYLFSRDHVNAYENFPPLEAMQDALTRFYLSRMAKGETVNVTRVLELVERTVELKADLSLAGNRVTVQTYVHLGMTNEAVYAFYRYALSAKKRREVTYQAKKLVEISPALAQDLDFQWVLKQFGER